MVTFSGPTRTTTDADKFRSTGISTPSFDVKKFLEGGGTQTDPAKVLAIFRTKFSRGGGGSGSSSGVSNAERIRREEEKKRQLEAQRIADQQKLAEALRVKTRREQRSRAEERKQQIIIERKLALEKRRLAKIKVARERVAQLKEFKDKLLKAKKEQLRKIRLRGKKFQDQPQLPKDDSIRFEQRVVSNFISKGRNIPIIQTVEINERTGKERILGVKETREIFPDVLTIPERKKGLERLLSKSKEKTIILRTQKEREEDKKNFKKNIARESQLALLTLGTLALETITGLRQLPQVLGTIVKNPKVLAQVPASIKRAGVGFGKLIRTSPTEALVRVGGEVLLLKGTGKAFKVVGTVKGATKSKIVNVLNRVKIKSTKIELPSIKPGKTLTLKIVGGTADVLEPLRKQIKLAGKKVTAVSGQADQLVTLLKRKRLIRKPIPGEDKLTPLTKKLLKQFDEGKINKFQLTNLERRIFKETKGSASLIERSFFADPRGRIRARRLGTGQKEASLLDILGGDVTFKTPKPQILVFEDVRVQALPKSLASIKKKLRSGKTLTSREANKFLKFQLKKSGKFKPVGALSKESEITLAPGEIVKKVKTVGFVKIGGKRIPIVRARVGKATQSLKKLLKKGDKGKLTTKELKILKRKLKKESGFKNAVSRDRPRPRPRVRVPKKIPRIRARPRPKTRLRKRITRVRRPTRRRVTTTRTTTRRTITTPRPRPRPILRRTTTTPRPRPRPPIRPRVKTPKPLAKIRGKIVRRVRKKTKKAESFNVFARPLKRIKGKIPKLIKINKVPLSKARAKDVRNYAVDQSLSRTARIRPARGKPKNPRLGVPRGYAKRTTKKFRRFRVIKGKRKALPQNKIIERSKNTLDTRREKAQISLKRIIARINKPKRRVKKRKR